MHKFYLYRGINLHVVTRFNEIMTASGKKHILINTFQKLSDYSFYWRNGYLDARKIIYISPI